MTKIDDTIWNTDGTFWASPTTVWLGNNELSSDDNKNLIITDSIGNRHVIPSVCIDFPQEINPALQEMIQWGWDTAWKNSSVKCFAESADFVKTLKDNCTVFYPLDISKTAPCRCITYSLPLPQAGLVVGDDKPYIVLIRGTPQKD